MDCSQSLIATVSRVIDMVADPVINLVDVNIARWLSNIRETVVISVLQPPTSLS